ncbi:hypothetical protein C8R44DRAFT_895693 [Mycena epipterygia]|nr:hypothetical protein C8R44DRAFT_895693 [Mycena epipterygia]
MRGGVLLNVALLQILNPGDPDVPFVALVVGLPDCNTVAFSNFANPAAILAPSDGFPHGALPTPGTGRTTFTGGYGNLFSWCAEPMAFLVRTAFGRDVLTPVWTDPNGTQHSLFIVQDLTRNLLAATPDPDIYASTGNLAVEEVVNATQSTLLRAPHLTNHLFLDEDRSECLLVRLHETLVPHLTRPIRDLSLDVIVDCPLFNT